ncbi:MAG: radical SAM family heme chaperone HemW [Bacteroidales bacterium]|nr:radical SAM family heme chaperone HemW [Bacteroidales bacterium]
MAGIYLHIPFCRQKCHYCNFYSLATKKYRNEIVIAMKREIELNKDFFGGEPVQTIYFGGGTPSLLPVSELIELIEKVKTTFEVSDEAEITVEANPDDLTDEWLKSLSHSPANRLSIGIQSFDDRDLHYLNRVHSAAEAKAGIGKAIAAGFSNLSIDLIYGIPTLSDETWLENINTAVSLNIPHISAYALTVEEGTALDHLIRKGKYTPVDDEKAVTQFKLLMATLDQSGYEHYEISNFSLPGHYSRHNKAYWNDAKYLGIGPSAHSYDGRIRRWNVSNLGKYTEGISLGNGLFEFDKLTSTQHFNEYVMTSLRTMWGIDLAEVNKRFGQSCLDHLNRELKNPEIRGRIVTQDNKIVLTNEGKLFADRMAAGFFM